MRALLIVNSTASTVDKNCERQVIALLHAALSLDVNHTSARGDATEAARRAAADDVDVVFCLGGDGTANETARGLIDTETALASLPGGSTNVFSRSLGFPRDAVHAASAALRSLTAQVPTAVGIGEVEVNDKTGAGADASLFDEHGRRPFLFHCGGGFDAQVTERVERTPQLKRRLGHLFFATAAASTWFARDHVSITVECIRSDGRPIGPFDDTKFAVASNTDPYSYLGSRPLAIAPTASLDAPLVSTAARSLSPIAAAGILTGALRVGSSVTNAAGVEQVTELAEIRWRSSVAFPLQADGEPLGRTTDVRLRHRPAALCVVRPLAD